VSGEQRLVDEKGRPVAFRNVYETDVCVYGATIGGVFAAIAVKKSGKTVTLLEQHPTHIGGMSTGGLSFNDVLTSSTGLWPLALDFYTRCATYYGVSIEAFMATHCNGEPSIFMFYLRQMMAENGVTAINGVRVESVAKSGAFIESITLTDGSVVRAKRFIDSSYEGDLMMRSGCSFTWGREANATYAETYNGALALADLVVGKPIDPYVTAGDPTSGLLPNVQATATTVGQGDRRVVGYNYRLCMTQAASKITPPDPSVYDANDYEYLGRLFAASAGTGLGFIFTSNALKNGKYDWNANGAIGTNLFGETYRYPIGDYKSRDDFNLRLKNYTLGLFKFIRTDGRVDGATKAAVSAYGFCADEFMTNGGFPPVPYIRESVRMVGDYVFKESDLTNYSNLDGICYGGYALDSHYVSLVNSGGVMKCEGTVYTALGYYYPIPYRALLPKAAECKNLLVTYCISATHSTFGSLRMEWTHMGIGEAAGYAAALSISKNKELSALNSSYVQNAIALNPTGVVMDPLAPSANGIITITGAWTTSANQSGKEVWGQNYIHDNNAGKGTKFVRYTPALPAAGSYEIWAKFKDVNDASRASNVPYTVQRSAGTSTGTYSQKVPGGGVNTFLSIGTFTMVGDGTDYFEIGTTGTAGGTYVCADAVVFQPKFEILSASSIAPGDFPTGEIQQIDVTVTSAQLLALNLTPVQLIAAPITGYAIALQGAMFTKIAGTAYAGIAAGEDLAIRYTDASGAIVAEVETTGFLDQATAQMRYVYPFVAGATSPVFSVAPVAASPLMLHMLVGDITTGNTDLKIRLWYRIIPSAL